MQALRCADFAHNSKAPARQMRALHPGAPVGICARYLSPDHTFRVCDFDWWRFAASLLEYVWLDRQVARDICRTSDCLWQRRRAGAPECIPFGVLDHAIPHAQAGGKCRGGRRQRNAYAVI